MDALDSQIREHVFLQFRCIFLGALGSACSPFSTGGAQVISMAESAETQDMLTKKLIPWAIALPIAATILALVGLWSIIPGLFGNTAF